MLSSFTEWLFNIIGDLFNLVWAIICSTIYSIIAAIFNVFNTLTQLNVLSDFGIEDIYKRITMIIIIVMAFYITFEMVKYVVQPDMLNDKSKGTSNMVKKIALVILLLAFTPDIFSLAYDLQGRILNGHVIEKVILGEKYNESDNGKWFKTAGANFAGNLFGMFFTLDEEDCPNGASTNSACKLAQGQIDLAVSTVKNVPINGVGNVLLGLQSIVVLVTNMFNGHLVNFSGLIAIGVGIYVLWSLLVYSIELANRYFQLIYLQMMAPVAIIGHLAPSKDSMLSKWFKQCITTYLDLFIRIVIINFVIFVCSLLHEKIFGNAGLVGGSLSGLVSGSEWTYGSIFWVYLFLIIGLFRFVSKAPKLFKELFPSSGGAASGGFSLTEPFKSAFGTATAVVGGASRAIGGVVGAYTGINTARKSAKDGALKNQTKRSKIWSGMKAGYQGAKTGFSKGGGIRKANEAAMGSVQKDEDVVLAGGTIGGHDFQGNKYQRIAKEQDRAIADYQAASKSMDNMTKQLDEFKQVKTIKKAWDAAKAAGNDSEARKLENQYKALSSALRGAIVEHNGVIKMENGQLVDGDGNRVEIKYKYTETDANGAAIPGTERVESYQFDSGDSAFAAAFKHVASEERRKTVGTALDNLEVEIKVQKVDPNTGQKLFNPDGTPVTEKQTKTVGQLTEQEYAEFINKVKDAASIAETKTYDEDYTRAHANSNGSGGGNK